MERIFPEGTWRASKPSISPHLTILASCSRNVMHKLVPQVPLKSTDINITSCGHLKWSTMICWKRGKKSNPEITRIGDTSTYDGRSRSIRPGRVSVLSRTLSLSCRPFAFLPTLGACVDHTDVPGSWSTKGVQRCNRLDPPRPIVEVTGGLGGGRGGRGRNRSGPVLPIILSPLQRDSRAVDDHLTVQITEYPFQDSFTCNIYTAGPAYIL